MIALFGGIPGLIAIVKLLSPKNTTVDCVVYDIWWDGQTPMFSAKLHIINSREQISKIDILNLKIHSKDSSVIECAPSFFIKRENIPGTLQWTLESPYQPFSVSSANSTDRMLAFKINNVALNTLIDITKNDGIQNLDEIKYKLSLKIGKGENQTSKELSFRGDLATFKKVLSHNQTQMELYI